MILLSLLFACGDDCGPGDICTVAGIGEQGLGASGTPAREAHMYWPSDVELSPAGTPYVTDWNNHRIIKLEGVESGKPVDPDGLTLRVVSGGGMVGDGPWDAPASTALWNHPTNITFEEEGRFLFAAWHNSRIIRIDENEDWVELVGGNGSRSFEGDGGPAVDAGFDLPVSVQYGPDGTLYFADQANQRIRAIGADGIVHTVVGTGEPRFDGDGGPAILACIQAERSQDAQPGGRIRIADNQMYIADTANFRIRVVDLDTWIIDSIAGNGEFNIPDEGLAPMDTPILNPRDVAVGPDGVVYYVDSAFHCVRAIDGDETWTVAGVCGEEGYDGDGKPANEALLNMPYGIDVADDGTLWIADTYNSVIRIVRPEE